jgi:type II secretory pathway pseudopilin PulG
METSTAQEPRTGTEQPRRRAARVVFELALIIVGVLIALAVDEWRERRDAAATAAAALQLVEDEIERNAALAAEAQPRHVAVGAAHRKALDVLRDSGRFERPTGDLADVRPSVFTRSGYDALLLAGVATALDPETLAAIAAAYEAQDNYRDVSQRYFSSVLATDFTDGQRYFQQLWFWSDGLAELETELGAHYARARQAIAAERLRLGR